MKRVVCIVLALLLGLGAAGLGGVRATQLC